MVKRGGRATYANVNLPKQLLDGVDFIIKEVNPVYRSRAEFVKYAIIDKINLETLAEEGKASAMKPSKDKKTFEYLGDVKLKYKSGTKETADANERISIIEDKLDIIIKELKKK